MGEAPQENLVTLARALTKSFLLGSFLAALGLHIAVSVTAPGDIGTLGALADGLVLFTILAVVSVLALFVFPIAALVSWPFRSIGVTNPRAAFAIAGLFGCLVGLTANILNFRVGPDDNYSGPIVGTIFAVTWVWMVRTELLKPRSVST